MSFRRPFRSPISGLVVGLLVSGSYAGCLPDLDALTAGQGGAGSDGTGSSGRSGNAGDTGAGGGGTGGTMGSGGAGEGGASNAGGMVGSGGEAGGNKGDGGNGGMPCESGLTTCPGAPACSTDLDVGNPNGDTVDDCGACGVTCSLENAQSAECNSGVCEPSCENEFDDCNARVANDGCETDLGNGETCATVCDDACSTARVDSVSCDGGLCTPICVSGFGNCNGESPPATDDGCETYLDAIRQCTPDCETMPVDCDPLEVCNAGTCGPPQGVVKFTVPFTTSGQNQLFADTLADFPVLTNEGVTVRLYAPGATAGLLLVYFSSNDSGQTGGGGATLDLTTLADGWVEQTFNVQGPTGTYDPNLGIRQINFQLQSDTTTQWDEPVVLYIDSVHSTSPDFRHTFDEEADLSTILASSFTVVADSTFEWLDAVPNP